MKKRKLICAVNVILIGVFFVAAFNIGSIYYNYSKADSAYAEIQSKYVEQNVSSAPTKPLAEENVQADALEPYLTVDFSALQKRNEDVVGWLYCPNTVINYPVVKGQDNDQYLHKDLDHKYLYSGTLFADYRCDTLKQNTNYIIYGHNMKNGTMFGALTKYKEQEYYYEHPTIYYLTPDGNYRLQLFAGLVVKSDDAIYSPEQYGDFLKLLEDYKAKSTFTCDVTPLPDDIIVTLSTCSYEFDNARYIVIGRLLPE